MTTLMSRRESSASGAAVKGIDRFFAHLRVYTRHLRSRLEPDPARSRFLNTEPGVGYRLRLDEETIATP